MPPVSDEESLLPSTLAAPPPSATLNPPPRARSYLPSTSFITRVLGERNAPTLRISESLDYEPLQNQLYVHQLHQRAASRKKFYGYTGHTLAKFVITITTGIATGLLASGLSHSVDFLHDWKRDLVQGTLDAGADGATDDGNATSNIFLAVLKFLMIGGTLVTVATALVQYWAPAASGAGVTLVMAYLNGNHIPHLLRPSTLVAKFVGTVASVASGLPMGPEGPMVHIGACVASAISYVDCKLVRNGRLRSAFGQFRLNRARGTGDKLKVLDDIVSDTDHREFISAGVSAGIAAAFGAPIGGVLYSMEEACSFWSRKVAWRCFIAGTLSTFTVQIMTRGAAHGAIAFSNLERMEVKDWLMQLPFLLVNFVMAGLLGAAFNSMRMWLWKIRAAKTMHIQRILEVLGLLLLVAICGFFFAWAAGTCIDLPEDWWKDDQVGGQREYGMRFLCSEKQHNDVATLFLSSTHHTIVRLFSMGRVTSVDSSTPGPTSSFTPSALALYTLVYLVVMSLGAGLAIPGGLFMPSIVVGASWGSMWGILVQRWMPLYWNVQPGLYALLAATGVLGGVFRSVISLVVLMVEGTQGIEFLPGVILAVVCANWVAHYIHHDGVYESELERTGNVYMLRDEPPHRLHTLTTQDIMATGVVGLRSIESVRRVLEVLRTTTHNGFPVFVQEAWGHAAREAGAAAAAPPGAGAGAGADVDPDAQHKWGGQAGGWGAGSSPGHLPQQQLLHNGVQHLSAHAGASLPGGWGQGGDCRSGRRSESSEGTQGAGAAEPVPQAAIANGSWAAGAGAGTPRGAGVPPVAAVAAAGHARLEGFVLRSQLLVLLQRRHFCDARGYPVGRDHCDKYDLELETEMRTFFRRYYTHSRYLSATPTAVDKLALRGTSMQEHATGLYLDLRPFMNRAPFTIRTDCSAARAHQVFTGIGLRHLLVVDAAGDVVGIITRKDLDHAAGHGWWRMSSVAEPPQHSTANRFWSGVDFLRSLVGSTPSKSSSNLQQQQLQQQQQQAEDQKAQEQQQLQVAQQQLQENKQLQALQQQPTQGQVQGEEQLSAPWLPDSEEQQLLPLQQHTDAIGSTSSTTHMQDLEQQLPVQDSQPPPLPHIPPPEQ